MAVTMTAAATLHPNAVIARPCIALVGAGPGDPDLLTMAACKALKAADLIVADRLVSQEILALIPDSAEVKIARKTRGCAKEAQEEINNWCLDGLKQNKNVVRLKCGDPFLFGRGGEEVLYFRERGIDARVIPGVSACLAAPIAAGIPVTHRDTANRLVVCTGMAKNGGYPAIPAYDPCQTVVFLMAVGRAGWVVGKMIDDGGYPADCPAAIIEKATMPGQRTVWGCLANIVERAKAADVGPPATMAVGQTVLCLDGQHRSMPGCILAASLNE